MTDVFSRSRSLGLTIAPPPFRDAERSLFPGLWYRYEEAKHPRDKTGKWTDAGTSDALLHQATALWQTWPGLLAIRGSIVAGTPIPEAQALTDAMAKAPRTTVPLYRGMMLNPGSPISDPAEGQGGTKDLRHILVTPGAEFRIPLSSFTDSESTAAHYAAGEARFSGLSVIVVVDPGIKALDLGPITASRTPEHITSGTFRVTKVEPDALPPLNRGEHPITRVTVSQVEP